MKHGRFHGLRFQKRIRVFPGVHVNLSLSGVGVSAGGRGFHVGWTARGQRYVSAGIPGTGLSVRQYSPTAHAPHSSSEQTTRGSPAPHNSPPLRLWPLALAIIILAVLLVVARMNS